MTLNFDTLTLLCEENINKEVRRESNVTLTYAVYEDGFKDLHSFNDEPSAIYFTNDRKFRRILKWHKHGLVHRDNDMPAYINLIPNMMNIGGNNVRHHWYKDGYPHRDGDKPNTVVTHNGKIIIQAWVTSDDDYHNMDGPAIIINRELYATYGIHLLGVIPLDFSTSKVYSYDEDNVCLYCFLDRCITSDRYTEYSNKQVLKDLGSDFDL